MLLNRRHDGGNDLGVIGRDLEAVLQPLLGRSAKLDARLRQQGAWSQPRLELAVEQKAPEGLRPELCRQRSDFGVAVLGTPAPGWLVAVEAQQE